MALLIKTYIDKSNISGIGLFAVEYIPIGTITWKFKLGFDLLLDHPSIYDDEILRKYIEKYAYYEPNFKKYVLCSDNARFMNHSDNPNTIGSYDCDSMGGCDISIRDIKPNEELTCNYYLFDIDANNKLKDFIAV